MGRLQEYTDQPDLERGGDLPEDPFNSETELERQKQTDLARAQARSVARPIKKERRHSQVEGRYIRPEEVKKEVAKLEQAKREAAEKKKGFFSRLFKNKKEEQPPAAAGQPEKKTEKQSPEKSLSLAERKQKAAQIQKLRGIAIRNEDDDDLSFDADDLFEDYPQERESFDSIPEETETASDPATFSFAESVKRLAEEQTLPLPDTPQGYADYAGDFPRERQENSDLSDEIENAGILFAPVDAGMPDGTIATALSVAVGFIYWDEDGQLVDRIITIRRLFARGGDILIDAFCHDVSAPRLIPFSKGVRLYQLRTMAACENPREFLLYHVAGLNGNNQADSAGFARVLSVVRYDLAALAFVAGSDFNKSGEENELMLSYVSQRCPTIDFDENEMLDYISMLVPDEQSFFEAIEIVAGQPQDIVFLFVHTFLQMMLSDGVLHENERELLAELLYLLQLKGIELNRLGLE